MAAASTVTLTLANVRTTRALREQKVLGGLKTGDPCLLFVLAVDQFKEKPTKSKFIAIYDLFINDNGDSIWGSPMGEFNSQRREDMAIVNLMKGRVDWCRELRQKASTMGFFERITTSSDRSVAMAAEFDAFMDKAKIMGQVTGLIQESRERTFETPGWRASASTAKKILKDAGFDISRLGLIGIP